MGVTRADEEIVIDAPPPAVFATITDFERIPEWQKAVVATRVLERDSDGLGTRIEFHIDVKVRRLRYVNDYSYDEPHGFDVRLVEGDLKDIDATYRFDDLGDGRTHVRHALAVDPGIFVPGPIKTMLTGRMLRDVLTELKTRVEELHHP
jgi:ribosome-associated toxin RatA of RatAB toxin-antitoxin module